GSRNRSSFILGRAIASPSHTQGGSRMRESRTYGSVRGARDETHVPTATEASSSCVRIGRPSDCADEVTLARKGAKIRRSITGLRSKTTEARTYVDRLRAANADLKKKLAEALDQQTATSEVLQVIGSSPGQLEPVFQAVLENATRICEAKFGVLHLSDEDGFRTVALHGARPELAEARRREPVYRPTTRTALGRAVAIKQPVQIADVQTEPGYFDAPPGL